jgi:phosphoserine phosphatase
MGSSKRLYLGTEDRPKVERVQEAIRYIRDRLNYYDEELDELRALIRDDWLDLDTKGRKFCYDLVVFDLGGAIFEKPWHESTNQHVTVSTWDLVFQKTGLYDIHEKMKQNFANGGFATYTDWTEAACIVLKSAGLEKKTFDAIIADRPISKGARKVFQILRANHVKTAAITGSFDALAIRANKELGGIDAILAHCRLIFNQNGHLESWELHSTDYDDKAQFVVRLAQQYGIPLERIAYVGDDVNDLEAFKKVGLAIAFGARKLKVLEAADVSVESEDLQAILPHLYVSARSRSA